jgi:H+/gluconate symporter-like permease
MNVLAVLTGTASGGMAIALNALGDTFLRLGAEHGIDPALMHRITRSAPARSTLFLTMVRS